LTKSVLITGVTGYLGNHVAKAFKKKDWTVHGFDNKHTTNPYLDVFTPGDVTDPAALDRLFGTWKFDMVVHLAARIEAGISVKEPHTFYQTNTGGTANVVKAMIDHGVDKIVFSSTAAVYKTKEEPIKETDPLEFNSPYGHSKQMAEEIIQRSGLKYTIFRFFNLTGADPDGEFGEAHEPETHLIPRLIMNQENGKFIINGTDYPTEDGTNVRDYVHVTDVAEAIYDGARHLNSSGQSDIFNLGCGTGYGIMQIIDELEICSGKKVKYKIGPRRQGDAVSLIADITKAKEVLNYTRRFDIVSILNTAYKWHNRDTDEETTSKV